MNAVRGWIAMVGAFVIILAVLYGQPPKHCACFVPVRDHPGIYSCSEYPRPVSVRHR